MTRRTSAIPGTISVLALLLWAGVAGAGPREEPEPRLILPGDRVVRAGQLVQLRWTPADSVSELEILLSVDGGRHYSLCVSPELEPDRCEYVWRVPHLDRATLRLRIRFNRGGREIEGAPTAPLSVVASGDDRPEPLGLPPLDGAGGRTPRPVDGRDQAPVSRSTFGSGEIANQPMSQHRSSSRSSSDLATSRPMSRPAGAPTPGPAPRFVPLRL